MKRPLVVALLLSTGCIDFNDAYQQCAQTGPCRDGGAADAQDAGGGGGAGGGTGAADPFTGMEAVMKPGPVCENDLCWLSPLPQGGTLRDVYAYGDRAVMVGEYGIILYWNGSQFFWAKDSVDSTLYSVTAEPSGRITYGGVNRIGQRLPDGRWVDDDPCRGVNCVVTSVWAGSGGRVAGGTSGNEPFFSEFGDTLSPNLPYVDDDAGSQSVIALGGAAASDLTALTLDGRLLERVSAGIWRQRASLNLPSNDHAVGMCVRPSAPVYVAQVDGTIASFDGGWSTVAVADGFDAFRCGPDGSLLAARNNNATYELRVCSPTGCSAAGELDGYINSVHASDTMRWAVGTRGAIARVPTATGASEQLRRKPISADIVAFAKDPGGVVYGVGGGQLVFHLQPDAGVAIDTFAGAGATYTGIAFDSPGHGYVIDSTNQIHRFHLPWAVEAQASIALISKQAYNGAVTAIVSTGQDVVVGGRNGLIAHLAPDGGFVSLRDDISTSGPGYPMSLSAASDGVAIATGGTDEITFVYADGGLQAHDTSVGATWLASTAASSGDVWVVGNGLSYAHLGNMTVVAARPPSGNDSFTQVARAPTGELWALDDSLAGQLNIGFDGNAATMRVSDDARLLVLYGDSAQLLVGGELGTLLRKAP